MLKLDNNTACCDNIGAVNNATAIYHYFSLAVRNKFFPPNMPIGFRLMPQVAVSRNMRPVPSDNVAAFWDYTRKTAWAISLPSTNCSNAITAFWIY